MGKHAGEGGFEFVGDFGGGGGGEEIDHWVVDVDGELIEKG